MIAALTPHEIVDLLVDDRRKLSERVRDAVQFCGRGAIRFHHIQTVDSWIRDYGPNFLIGPMARALSTIGSSTPGETSTKSSRRTTACRSRLEPVLKLPRFSPGIVMEGGSIEVNGAGCVLTTEQCLLNPNRNPELTREQNRAVLKRLSWSDKGFVAWRGHCRRRY